MTAIKQIRRTPSMPPWARYRAANGDGGHLYYQRSPVWTTVGRIGTWRFRAGDFSWRGQNYTAGPAKNARQSLRRIVSARGGK